MRRPRAASSARGFTLIEVLVVLAVLAIALGLGIPALENLLLRSRLEASGTELTALVQRARLEAIKRRTSTIVEIDTVARTARAWAEIDGADAGDPPDLVFNPVAGEPRFTTDFVVQRLTLPETMKFDGPGAQPAAAGLTLAPDGRRILVFLPTGAADASGGFRITDVGDLNHLEVRVDPAGTGRVGTRKWDRDLGTWLQSREGGRPWTWYTAP